METPKMVVFVVKRYAVCEAKKWRYAVRNAKIERYAVSKGGGGCHPRVYGSAYGMFPDIFFSDQLMFFLFIFKRAFHLNISIKKWINVLHWGQPCVLVMLTSHFCGKITLSKISARNLYKTVLSALKILLITLIRLSLV